MGAEQSSRLSWLARKLFNTINIFGHVLENAPRYGRETSKQTYLQMDEPATNRHTQTDRQTTKHKQTTETRTDDQTQGYTKADEHKTDIHRQASKAKDKQTRRDKQT